MPVKESVETEQMHIHFCTGLRAGLWTSTPFSSLQKEGTLMVGWNVWASKSLTGCLCIYGSEESRWPIKLRNDKTKQVIPSQKLSGGSQTAEAVMIPSGYSDTPSGNRVRKPAAPENHKHLSFALLLHLFMETNKQTKHYCYKFGKFTL